MFVGIDVSKDRFDVHLRQRLVANGKPPRVAIVACMRRLLGIMRDQKPWQNA